MRCVCGRGHADTSRRGREQRRGLFTDPEAILHIAELGVVMFLFIIGLEMQPSRLWGLRRAIFGLGTAQVGIATLVLTLVGYGFGLPLIIAFVDR